MVKRIRREALYREDIRLVLKRFTLITRRSGQSWPSYDEIWEKRESRHSEAAESTRIYRKKK